jgi:hypothetical protein
MRAPHGVNYGNVWCRVSEWMGDVLKIRFEPYYKENNCFCKKKLGICAVVVICMCGVHFWFGGVYDRYCKVSFNEVIPRVKVVYAEYGG